MAIKSYVKGTKTKLSSNFDSTEFDCHGSNCCSTTLVDEKLVEYLQKIRTHFNKPVNISSAYRCATHNANVGGVTGSRHSKGQAADIYINGVAPAEIAKYAESIGILGIGLYETDADGHFVHVDTREYKSFWYGQKQAQRTTFGGAIVKDEETKSNLYSNSSLVTYTNITNNKTSPRNHAIDTITIHCIVGQWTAKQGCDYFATTNNQCSANYVVGKDGSIGLSVDERDRSWCSSSSSNDNRAITIEVASDTTHPYAVTDAAYKALIELVADICKRNKIKELKWKGDKSLIGQVDKQNMTVHRWFANKACPGDYLYERHGDIAAKVNAKLGVDKKEEAPAPKVSLYRVRKSWEDPKSQIGAYQSLANAKAACDKAGLKYFVFDEDGVIVYPEANTAILDTSHVNTKAADPAKIWNFFKSKGLNDCGIAGLMGNLYAESGFKPCNLQNSYESILGLTDAEYTVAVDSNIYTNFIHDKAGYGLAQWTYWSLKEDMLEYFQERSKSIGDLDTQLEFLAYQLSTSFKAVWSVLKTANTVREASDAVLLKFERPADQGVAVQEKRASYGQKYFDLYAVKEEDKPIQVPAEGENGKMKYSDKNKPLVCMQTQSTCYKGTSKMQVKGVLWHSTGANNPWLKRYVQPSDNATDREKWLDLLGKNQYNNDFNHITRQAGLNCWIGKLADGTVTTVQTMPWDYKPWGCGSGSKGSCNNGWIQFEICEDGLTDKAYFDKVYKEACEITAYLCDLYNIDPNGTVDVNGVKVPTILCHADSNKLGLGSNHGDVNHWFPKHGKSMATARKDVADLLNTNATPSKPPVVTPDDNEIAVVELYRVRKTWEDAKSQIGAYKLLKNAIIACDKAGAGYEVYDNNGVAVYPEVTKPEEEAAAPVSFKVGDIVRLLSGATYTSGTAIPSWVFKYKLYVREIRKSGAIVISTQKSGAVTGVVNAKYLVPYNSATTITPEPTFTPYLVKIDTAVLNVRTGAGTTYKITTQVKKNQVYTIVAEKDGWGKLKSGAGWISLDYTKKL